MTIQLFDNKLCAKCRGRGFCKKPCKIYLKIKDFIPKTKTHFSGESPPEIFVGRYNYPNISAGILSPDSSEPNLSSQNSEEFAFPEIWHEKKLPIEKILSYRGELIYGKFKTNIKKTQNKLLNLMQEISLSYKPVSTEFFLRKPPYVKFEINKSFPLIGNPAPLEYARLQENPKIKPKVDYIVSDQDVKATTAIKELYIQKTPVSSISKILSAGILGLKTQRKLVPTRWSITAVDDILSKELLKKIRYYHEINEVLLFHSELWGNHYEILLLPSRFSFEVIEAEISGSLWNESKNISIMKDFEFFYGKKNYAKEVSGAYYANRLALCEYLEKIKRQASALFFRQISEEYYAPLGVGILREICRDAFKKPPEKFETTKEALEKIQSRLRIPIEIYTKNSVLLKEFGKQRKLNEWLNC